MKLLSLFSGIGAFEKALDNLGIPYELVGYCEIDKWASKSYAAIHNVTEDMNLGDITKVDEKALPKGIDLVTYGFPCQDISLAGKQKGLFNEDGTQTRSGLFFEALRIIEETKPRIAIAENVKNLVGKKFKEQFKIVLDSLEAAGYNNYWKVLNAKDYGVPQNRERVFIVSIRKDIDTGRFEFPKGFPLELRLKDVLEEEVDEQYYCSSVLLNGFAEHRKKHSEKGNGFGAVVKDKDSIANTIPARYYKDGKECLIQEPFVTIDGDLVKIREATAQGYAEAVEGDTINLEQPNSKTRRGRVGKQVAQTLTTTPNQAVIEPMALDEQNGYIRKDGCVGTITTDGSSPKKNNRIIEMPCSTRGSQVASTIRSTIYKQGERNIMQNIENGLGYEGVIEAINAMPDGTCRTLKNQYHKTSKANFERTSTFGATGVTDGLRIRKLTPRECFRLMGFDDNDFEKAEAANSNTQLYKQAGNSIVVSVVAYIIAELIDCGVLYGPVAETSNFNTAPLRMVEIVATVTDDDVDALKVFFRSRGIPKTSYTIY